MPKGQCSQVALGYALKTLKPRKVIDRETPMVRRQAVLWERVQCVALGDGEAPISYSNRLRADPASLRRAFLAGSCESAFLS